MTMILFMLAILVLACIMLAILPFVLLYDYFRKKKNGIIQDRSARTIVLMIALDIIALLIVAFVTYIHWFFNMPVGHIWHLL